MLIKPNWIVDDGVKKNVFQVLVHGQKTLLYFDLS